MHTADTAPPPPVTPSTRRPPRARPPAPHPHPVRPGPCSPSRSPPRSLWSWTSRSSTPRCRPSARRSAWAAATCSGWSPPTCCSPAADCCSAAASPTCCRGAASSSTGLTIFAGVLLCSAVAGNAAAAHRGSRHARGWPRPCMTPAALSLIMTTYAGAQREGPRDVGAVGSLGVAAGVLLGGALTTWAGWQLIFWVNVPIGAVGLAVAVKVLPRQTPYGARPAPSSTCPAPPRSSAA